MKQILLILALLTSVAVNGQDIMYLMNGDTMTVNVFEVSESDVKYKLLNQDNPSYVMSKAKIYMVEYANGRKEVFASQNVIKKDIETTVMTEEAAKKREEIEKKYRQKKGGGIAGTMIGSVALAISIPFLIDESIKLSNTPKENRSGEKVIGASFGMLMGVLSLSMGVGSLVKASVYKEQLRNMPVAIKPVLMDGVSYSGSAIKHSSGFGVGITYSF